MPRNPPKRTRTGASPVGLEMLLGPARDRFLRDHWPGRPFVYHGPVERLHRLTALEPLQSVPKLLSARAASYQDMTVFGGNGFAKLMPPREAIHFYQRGDNLSCTALESTIPQLRVALGELAVDLKGPVQHWSCSVFAAGGGRGVTMHYDPVLTFNVQLQGEKVWRLAPNRHVDRPVKASDSRHDHAPAYAAQPLPTTMPADALTFRAKPGSVVFIPRGYWHETDTFGESLAVTFVLHPPSWRDLVVDEVRRALVQHAAWRDHPIGIAGGPARRAALAHHLDGLLEQLRVVVGSLDIDAVLASG